MAHLAVVGSHSTNGVAAIHSGLLRTTVLKDLADAVPRSLQQQDQRRDAEALAPAGQPRPLWPHHPGDRRRLGHRLGSAPRSSSLWPTTPLSAMASVGPSARPRPASPTGCEPRPARWSTPRRSSTLRSSGFTNTSGSCSTFCMCSCSTTDCARTPASTCRRARSSSPARRRRRTRWRSSSST